MQETPKHGRQANGPCLALPSRRPALATLSLRSSLAECLCVPSTNAPKFLRPQDLHRCPFLFSEYSSPSRGISSVFQVSALMSNFVSKALPDASPAEK